MVGQVPGMLVGNSADGSGTPVRQVLGGDVLLWNGRAVQTRASQANSGGMGGPSGRECAGQSWATYSLLKDVE